MPDSRVYILGAGCSKDCGYPLGPEMKDDLEGFGQSLDPATSLRLLKAVKDTVDLMVGTTDTVDILVQKLYGGHLDSRIGGSQNQHPYVVSATLATAAAFLAKEPAARQTGLKQFREFISDLFPCAKARWDWMPPQYLRQVLRAQLCAQLCQELPIVSLLLAFSRLNRLGCQQHACKNLL
jgi:hypothetical protein